jgi:rare lipoprotein A
MGRALRGKSLGWSRVGRVGVIALGGLMLAQCSSGSQYNERVIADADPVPKGGGTYQVGKPYQINGRTYVPNENPSYRAEGIASWYGPDFHGRSTANGELYDMHAISAAHTTMPLPSYARVTNLDNKRSIVVRVNDRGPYVRDRIIDLSIGTAKALDCYGKGLARVRVEYMGRAPVEGSDDKMLLATLREGSPAPAPSKVMIAAAKPFLPKIDNKRERGAPADRGFSLASSEASSERVSGSLKNAREPGTSGPAPTRSKSASADPRAELPMAAARPIGEARSDAPATGVISGRGLY